MKCKNTLFAFMLMLMLTCNLNAQEASPETTNELNTVIAETLADADEELDSALEADDSANEDEGEVDDLKSDEMDADEMDADEMDADEMDADEMDADEMDADEMDEDEMDEDEMDEDEMDEDDHEEEHTGPITVTVNENGELVGQARADVGGDLVPVEANVALVANGVLLSKIVAEQDGSFAFANVAPGDYNICGSASSYCGQQAVSVQCNCGGSVDAQDSVGLRLSQSEQSCCYSQLGSAPAATFGDGSSLGFSSGGGFGGGGGLGGGGFAAGAGGGGGVASGVSGLRLLAVGGIATAVAVGSSDDDDDISPSN